MNTNSIPVLILNEPEADSCLFSGGLETKPTKIQASGGRKPPDSRSIDDRGLFLFFTSSKLSDGQILHLAIGERGVLIP